MRSFAFELIRKSNEKIFEASNYVDVCFWWRRHLAGGFLHFHIGATHRRDAGAT